MKIDTTIKKRRFYQTQIAANHGHNPNWHTSEYLREYPSRAKVTFDGCRYTVRYRLLEPHEDDVFTEMYADARRMILQPSTRHIRGPQLTSTGYVRSAVVILAQRDLLSVQYDADHLVCHHLTSRDRLLDWCSSNLSGWFGLAQEGMEDLRCRYEWRELSFALFEDERDAIHFKLRWC